MFHFVCGFQNLSDVLAGFIFSTDVGWFALKNNRCSCFKHISLYHVSVNFDAVINFFFDILTDMLAGFITFTDAGLLADERIHVVTHFLSLYRVTVNCEHHIYLKDQHCSSS